MTASSRERSKMTVSTSPASTAWSCQAASGHLDRPPVPNQHDSKLPAGKYTGAYQPVLHTGGLVSGQSASDDVACPPQEGPLPLGQLGLRATTTSVSPGQSQKMPSAEWFASRARTSPAKSSRRLPNRCGAEDEREK